MPTSEYHIPVKDVQGHSVKVYFRCPGNLMEDLKTAIEKKVTPWTDISDFMRWAMVHGMNSLPDVPAGSGVRKQTMAILRVMREDETASAYDSTFHLMEETIKTHLKKKRFKMAERLAADIHRQILAMPEDDLWREVWLSSFLEKFADLLKSAPAPVRMLAFEPDPPR